MKTTQIGALTKVLNGFWKQHSKQPRRPGLVQYYQRLYYQSRIKPLVDEAYPALVQTASAKGQPCPKRVVVQNDITRAQFNAEKAEFKAELQAQLTADYEETLAAWQAGLSDEDTGEGRSARHYYE